VGGLRPGPVSWLRQNEADVGLAEPRAKARGGAISAGMTAKNAPAAAMQALWSL
jgi:hypothetical protein